MRAALAIATLAAGFAGPADAQVRASRLEIVPSAGWIVPGDLVRGPLGTALRTASAPVFGGTAALGVAGPLSVYAGAAYADSDLEVGLPVVGGVSLTDTRMLVLDAGIQARGSGAAAPLVQLGVGTMQYRVAAGPVDVKADNVIVTGGVGFDLELSRGVALRLLARDYVGRFDTNDAILVDGPVRTAHNLSLSAGLRLVF